MRTTSRTRYLNSIDRVVERLSETIANEQPLPSIAALASHVHMSEFHFMRIYRALAGESVGATIQRLRLQRAAHLLAQGSATITDAAASSGYETPQAFARAFRRHYGAAPGDVRRHPQKFLNSIGRPGTRRDPDTPPPVIDIEIVDLKPFRVAALRNHGDYANLHLAYTRLFEWITGHHALESISAIWGVPHHDRRDMPPEQCVFDCCFAISVDISGSSDIRISRLGGGRYATHRHVGSYLGLDDAHDLMLRQILLDERVAPRDAPMLHEYLNDPEITPEEALETVIYIPVQ